MRIALYHNLPSGGAKRAVFEWAKRLATRANIDEYTLSTAMTAYCDIRPYVQDRVTLEFVPHRLFKSPMGRLNCLQRIRDLRVLESLGRELADRINRGSYDVVFVHPCLYTFVPALLRWLEVPSVYYLHEAFGPGTERRFSRPYAERGQVWRRRLDRFDPLVALWQRKVEELRKRSLSSVTRLLSNSAYTREQMEAAYQVDSSVCRYGVDFLKFRPLEGIEKEPSVISVGELTPRKGFDFVIESLALIKEPRPKLKLIYNFADPNEKSYLEDLAKRLGVEMQLRANLGTEELAQEYCRSLLCLYAPIGEPFGLVPLESMACGTPVVAVAEGGIVESVVDRVTGRLTPRNRLEFADATRLLLADESLRRRYGKSGREHVASKWSWERSTESLFAHLDDVASRRSTQACRARASG